MRRRWNKRGQSVLEYAIIWTAIVGAILIAATKYLKPEVDDTLDKTSAKIGTEVERFVNEVGD